MLAKLDAWVGKTLFLPPIIHLCHLTGWTQWRVARMAHLLFWLHIIWSWAPGKGTGMKILDVVMCLLVVMGAGLWPDRPQPAHSRWHVGVRRAILVTLLVVIAIDAGLTLLFGRLAFSGNGLLSLNLLLLSEYARSIDTIPPREIRERRRAAQRRSA